MIGLVWPLLLEILHYTRIYLLGLGGGLHLTLDLRDKFLVTKFSEFDNKLVELKKKLRVIPQI
jgi:hypothetical protein